MNRLRRLLLCILFLAVPAVAHTQDVTPAPEPLQAATTGLLAEDGSVFYSVLLNSDLDALSGLTITSALPQGATFVDAFWTPESATFVGEADGSVSWTLPDLAAQTIIGPFTYQVTFDEAEAVIPAQVSAAVQWSGGEISVEPGEGELAALSASGSLSVDGAGTAELVPVENTGVYLFVPAGAFDQTVTLTFERGALDDETNLPPVPEGENIWWCTLFSVTVEPAGVEARQPITVLFPTRRTLTPGIAVLNFAQAAETWTDAPGGWVSPSGNYVMLPLTGAAPAISAGVQTDVRVTATATSLTKGSGWVDPEPVPWTDSEPLPNRISWFGLLLTFRSPPFPNSSGLPDGLPGLPQLPPWDDMFPPSPNYSGLPDDLPDLPGLPDDFPEDDEFPD